EVADDLRDGEFLEHAGRLRDDADPAAPAGAARGRVLAEDPHLAGVPVTVSLKDLHDSGLAGAVRAEQGEHLPGAHLEVEAVDGHHLPVPLSEAPYADGLLPRSSSCRIR